MNILITNQSLAVRAGTEPYVRDLARALQSLGHMVFGYSSDPGQPERLLERDLIAVATDLENLPIRPDVIHANHHLDAFTALTALPGVPAIYQEHGGLWQDMPPVHPRIHHHLAPSRRFAGTMAANGHLPGSRVSVFPLAVDGARFGRIREPVATPRRALCINKYFGEDSRVIQMVKDAAARRGLALDFAGREFGCKHEEAESILPEYDVVFAGGQAAAEALACGCAVVTMGSAGLGGMVTPDNFECLRDAGFDPEPGASPVDSDDLADLLGGYAAENCLSLARRIRVESDFPAAVQRLIGLYEEVMERQKSAVTDVLAEMSATARYLAKIAPGIYKVNYQKTGLMQPSIVWKPTTLPTGDNPQK